MWLEILMVVLTGAVLLYWYCSKDFNRWKELGIPYIPPTFPFGSHKEIFNGKGHMNTIIREDYKRFRDDDLYGWFLLGKPILGVNNLELIKDIFVKDFNHFVDRNPESLKDAFDSAGDLDKLWMNQLTNLSGDEWKHVRSFFSPIFTSGKMKTMLAFIKTIAASLGTALEVHADSCEDFELKDMFGKFSLDSLASCAFGVDAESFTNRESRFARYASRMFTNSAGENMLAALRCIPGVPRIIRLFKVNTFKPKETRFFRDTVIQVIRHRQQSGERRNDLIDLMVDSMRENREGNSMKQTGGLDEDLVVATAMVMLIAGYDTTGMSLAYAIYQLSKNRDVQDRLREEVDLAYEQNGGEMPDYGVIQAQPYLEMVIMENLRLHTPLGMIIRACTQDYRIPGTEVNLKKNDMVSIPVNGIHLDERYYPNPTQFNPDNFSKEARSMRNPYTFLAFGQGPRACIGMRFALLESKVAIMEVIRKFDILESSKTAEPLEMDPLIRLGYPKGGLWAKVSRRQI